MLVDEDDKNPKPNKDEPKTVKWQGSRGDDHSRVSKTYDDRET